MQNALASSGHTAPWYVFGILLLFGITLGRTICGWLCPLGLLQELLHKIPTPKLRKGRVTRALSWLKYVLLAVLVIWIPLTYGLIHNMPLPAFCKYICPAGTLEGAIALLTAPGNEGMYAQLGILFTRKFVILMVIIAACIFCYRSFCRFLCPLGAIYSLFNRFALVGVRVDDDRCTRCGACVKTCEMDVRKVNDRECISCGKCMESCAAGAISIKCGTITLKGPETGKNAEPADVQQKRKKTGRIVWGILIAILVFAVIWFNFIDVPASAKAGKQNEGGKYAVAQTEASEGVSETEAAESETGTNGHEGAVTIGPEVGDQLADFTVTLLDGSEFHLADTRGKVVFINEWATWCTACVNELPYFEKFKEEHPDVEVFAFHHSMEVKPPADEYVKEKGWEDWKIKFARNTGDPNLGSIINGGDALPITVVLDRDGKVIYNEQRSVTYEMLESLYEKASE